MFYLGRKLLDFPDLRKHHLQPRAEKLTCNQTKHFACFGAFDFRNMCFYLEWFMVKVGEKLRLCITQLRIDIEKI